MAPGPAGTTWRIRRATVADAPYMRQCHIECLAETYAHIMPPAFAQERRDRFRAECDELAAELEEMESALAHGTIPVRTHHLAVADDGEVVGVVSAGPGVPAWEREHFDNPEPRVAWNLDHLYTRARMHGTGLGQALLDVALASPQHPGGRGAWLWILRENPRAEAFYRRNGFAPDGLEVLCGPSWHDRPMFRMVRPEPVVNSD